MNTKVIRIMGIDPGSRVTGVGVVDVAGTRSRHVFSGCINVKGDETAERLKYIHQGITEVLHEWQPHEVAIEQVFLGKSFASAMKLGQARGVAMCAAALHGLPVAEYAPRAIKKAVVGTGAAGKDQVQHMIRALLNIRRPLKEDEADALAIALCHGNTRNTANLMQQAIARQSK